MATISTEERNLEAKHYVHELYSSIRDLTIEDLSSHYLFDKADLILTNLVNTKILAKGFRGIVLTAIVGKHLNKNYDFLNRFYDCNPRSIFENGIFLALRELKIPCGKSDPLNVAKNTNVLNRDWAEGKRPQKAADAVVDYLQLLNANFNTADDYCFLVKFFMFRLKELSDIHSSTIVTAVSATDELQQELAIKLWNFVSNAVEGGTIPQFFIGTLLEAIYFYEPQTTIQGTKESVSGTNTTSKKPGDLIVIRDGVISNIIEVTLKVIDSKRLSDSYDVLNDLGCLEVPITFICNIPKDTAPLENTASLENITYSPNSISGFIKHPHFFNFLDMENFICSTLALLNKEQINYLLTNLTEFISRYDRPLATKKIWNHYFPSDS